MGLDEIEFDQRLPGKLLPFGAGSQAPIMTLVEQRPTIGQHGEVVAGHRAEPLRLDRKARKRVALR